MPLDSNITAQFDVSGDVGRTDWSASAQWATRPPEERFISMDEMMVMLDARAAKSSAIDVNLSDIRPTLNDEGLLAFDVNGILAKPTNHSFHQFCGEIGAPTQYFTKALGDAPHLVAECLRHNLAQLDEDMGERQFYLTGNELRAVTSTSYGRIMDRDVLRAVMEATEASGCHWQVPTAFAMPGTRYQCIDPTRDDTTLYASDRDMYLFLVDQEHPIEAGFITDPKTGGRIPDVYSRGFIVKHGECGATKGTITSFLYRWVCCNRSIREQKLWQQLAFTHRANVFDHFNRRVVPAFRDFVNGSTTGVAETIKAASRRKVVTVASEAVHWLVQSQQLSHADAEAIVKIGNEEEGRPLETVYDAVQALTAFARRLRFQDERVLVERKAGILLDKVAA